MRNLIIVLLLFSFIISSVSADFIVVVDPVLDDIEPGETAVYDIITKNIGSEEDDLKFEFSEDPKWSIITTPIFHQASFKLKPDEEKITTIQIVLDESVDFGQKYSYKFKVSSNINDYFRYVDLDLFYRSPDRLRGYVPIVEIDVDLDSEIDPRKEGKLVVNLKNFNPLNITDMVIEVTSKVNSENDKIIQTQLSGLSEKSIELPIRYDPLQSPGRDEFIVTASVPSSNKSFDPKIKAIQILPYVEVEKDIRKIESFFKKHFEVEYYNDGNIETSEIYRVRTSLFQQIFTSAEPEPAIVKEGGYRYLEWNIVLPSQGREQISLTMNYRPLFIIFILISVAIVLYFVVRSPLVIKKEAIRLKKGDDASKIKILLHIKNRTGKLIENVNVLDKIPRIAVLSTDFPPGTMQPSKVIKHDKRGTIVKWTIPTLEAYEERIITYFIGSKLRIIGSMKLPATMVKYRNRMHKFSKTYSGKVTTY